MFAKINSCTNIGLDSKLVEVEADLAPRQQPAFIIVGLPDTSIQEAKERVRFAIENSGFDFPRPKITVNLAPADIRKEGPSYDLAIAISILQATNQLTTELKDSIFVGELALDGTLRSTNGILPIAIFAKENNYKNIYIPEENKSEAALISGINIYPIKNLSQLIDHLTLKAKLTSYSAEQKIKTLQQITPTYDMSFVKGQEQAKRAIEIAAAGAHNILLSGPPGSGKTFIAKTMPTILPEMTESEILEVTKIYSIAGLLSKEKQAILTRPFRSPHHTSSGVALVGGGKIPKPGEISLAHRGILFLDEFPEFPRIVLETLRQPMEDGIISISRAQGTLSFPAKFTLVASQNPCPCGYYSDPEKNCTCTPTQINKYQKKISGPLLDRIDLHIEVPRINFEKLQSTIQSETSAEIKKRVTKTQTIQQKRFANSATHYNSEMNPQEIKRFCDIKNDSVQILKSAVEQLHLSARSFHRILKVARTIADIEETEKIQSKHIAEALQYRSK